MRGQGLPLSGIPRIVAIARTIRHPAVGAAIRHRNGHAKTTRCDHVAEWRCAVMSRNAAKTAASFFSAKLRNTTAPSKARPAVPGIEPYPETSRMSYYHPFSALMQTSKVFPAPAAGLTAFLGCIMKNDPCGMTVTRPDAADAVSQIYLVYSLHALHGPMMHGKQDSIPLLERNDFGSGLHAGRCSVSTNWPPVKSRPGSDNSMVN